MDVQGKPLSLQLKELEVKWHHEKEKTAKAEAASRVKSAFMANMGHDIRTPITGMLAINQKILDQLHETDAALTQPRADTRILMTHLVETLKEDNALLAGATQALLTLCNDILTAVQLESGQMSSKTELCDMESMLTHIVRLLQPVATDKQLTLSYVLDDAVPHYLHGMRSYVDRILINLVSNALKFTQQGFVKITLKLAPEAKPPFHPGDAVLLHLIIEDTGIGMPEDKIETIFDYFEQLQPACEGKYQGSGLGLYTVKRYVELMQGALEVTSVQDKGSCFTLTLPFVCASQEDARRCAEQIEASAMPTMHAMGAQKQKTRSFQAAKSQAKWVVLIAEDNPLAALGLQQALQPFDCAIDLAATGTEAVNMVQNKHYDIVLMDVGLPDMSGIEATKKIRTLPRSAHSQIPIIALTGHTEDSDQGQACLDAGMQAVLSKPVNNRALASVFQAYVFDDTETANIDAPSLPPIEEKLPMIDWQGCMQRCNGDEDVLHQALAILAKDLHRSRSRLDQAYQDQDAKTLQAELHRIRGGVCYLALPELETALTRFNQALNDCDNTPQFAETYTILQQVITSYRDNWKRGFNDRDTTRRA